MKKTYGGFLMSRIRHLSERAWEKLLKESGVDIFNGPQGRILYALWENERLTISEIGKLTSLANSSLTGMLDRMEAAGLVERVPDKENRRRIYVSVTAKAKQYRDKYDWISDRASEIFYAGFSDAEIDDFENQLRRILKNFEEEEGV